MPAIEDQPTIAERYSSAVADGVGMTSVILAAGLQQYPVGATLMRLQSEYDTVRGELERAGEIARETISKAQRLERDAGTATKLAERAATPEKRSELAWSAIESADRAQALRRRTEQEILTARCLVLTRLKTLHDAKTRIGAYALVLATKNRFMVPNDVVLRLAGRVIDVWLDPVCHKCDGSGLVEAYEGGAATKQCSVCGGTGNRREQVGGNERARWFAFLLLGDIQREMALAAAAMGRKLRADG
jgi:hypothetical protein